jgi:hypothetical protein
MSSLSIGFLITMGIALVLGILDAIQHIRELVRRATRDTPPSAPEGQPSDRR